MATIGARPAQAADRHANLPGRRYDHLFFSSAALLMLMTVFVGFAPTYYLAGVFRAPLPSPIIHVHGAVFSLWILLLVTQTSMVAAGRVDIHRRLGIAAFLLACLMVVLGVMAATATDNNAFDGSFTDETRLIFAAVDTMLELEEARFTVSIHIIGD